MDSSLLDLFDRAVTDDPGVDRRAVLSRLTTEAPVFRSERLDAWVVTSYEAVRSVLRDGEQFVVPQGGVGAPVYGRTFLHMSGKEHAKKVGVVARRIRSRHALMSGLDERIARIARSTADALPLGEEVDLREQFAMWVPLLTITELADLGHEESFRHWYRAVGSGGTNSLTDPSARERALAARAELGDYVAALVERRRSEPGPDLFSELATAEYDGALLPVEEIVSSVVFLLAAGVETTERVLSSLLAHLAEHPDEWSWLREAVHDDDTVSAYSAEALRWFPPVNGVVRQATTDVDVAGTRVAEGERLVVLLAAANLDPTVFDDPLTYDPARFRGRGSAQFTAAGTVMPFGAGSHYCVGARLAQTEMRHALLELTRVAATIRPAREMPPSVGFMLRCPSEVPVVLEAGLAPSAPLP